MRFNWKLISTGLLLIALSVWLYKSSDYMHEKETTVTVLAKYLPTGGRRSHAVPVMVLKTEDGIIFDHYVSFSTYLLYDKGDRPVMQLRRMDIRQTFLDNLLYFVGPVFTFCLGALALGWVALERAIMRVTHNTSGQEL